MLIGVDKKSEVT